MPYKKHVSPTAADDTFYISLFWLFRFVIHVVLLLLVYRDLNLAYTALLDAHHLKRVVLIIYLLVHAREVAFYL